MPTLEELNLLQILIGAIFGSVLGGLFPLIMSFLKFVFFEFWRKDLIQGNWHAYHYSMMGSSLSLRAEVWTVEKNWRGQLLVHTTDQTADNLSYLGIFDRDNDELFLTMRGVNHKETDLFRFYKKFPTDGILIGLNLGVDFNHDPMCVAYALSREEFTNDQAEQIIRDKTLIKHDVMLSITDRYAPTDANQLTEFQD